MAAAAVARFYEGQRVVTRLVANNDSDQVLQDLQLRTGGEDDEIWVTDLSWNSTATGEHLTELAQKGARVYWIDHHRTAVGRANAPEFKVPFTVRVLSEQYSAARLTFNYLRRRAATLPARRAQAFEEFAAFAAIAGRSRPLGPSYSRVERLGARRQTLGGIESYREILRLREPKLSRRMRAALEAGREAMLGPLELARSTMVDRVLDNGIAQCSACCFGYSSEVAAALYEGQTRTVIALFDLRSQGVSLRRSADSEIDLSALARVFGGGGHAAAAGFATSDLKRAPAERLAELLGDRLTTA